MEGKIGRAARLKCRVQQQQVAAGDCPFVLIFLLARIYSARPAEGPKRLICRHPAAAPAFLFTIGKSKTHSTSLLPSYRYLRQTRKAESRSCARQNLLAFTYLYIVTLPNPLGFSLLSSFPCTVVVFVVVVVLALLLVAAGSLQKILEAIFDVWPVYLPWS